MESACGLKLVALVLLLVLLLLVSRCSLSRRRFLCGWSRRGRCYGQQLTQLRVSLRWWQHGVFNPSLLQEAGAEMAYLALRRSETRDQRSEVLIASSPLDSLEDTPTKDCPLFYGFMDLRLFNYAGRIWAAAHRLEDEETGRCAMYLLSIQKGQATRLDCFTPEDPMRSEKNWVPVPHDTGLYWVHTLSPFRLLRCRLSPGADLPPSVECEDVAAGSRRRLAGNGRGSSAARALAGGLLVATHERTRDRPPSYRQGLVYLAADPPFVALAQSAPFTLIGSDAETRDALGATRGSFHFINDLCCVGDDVLFCLGVADDDAVIVSASNDDVMARLQALP